ncbi:MAG: excinuclease ABC subunit UvrC [Porticoccaceae bacterium]
MFDAKALLRTLTDRPGVYQMLGDDGRVLYVGKAKNLHKRVASYFRSSGLAPKTRALVDRILSVEVTVTETELEALLLEQNLIKQYHPPFNILLRDDKSYPYIFLSGDTPYPRLSFHRGTKRGKGTYFGPFPGVLAVRETLNSLKKTFGVRQCEDSFFRNRSRPCLQYEIKRCSGPCVGLVSKEEYDRDVRHTRMFLEGKNLPLMSELETEMDRASDALAFESAAILRDQINSLRQIQATQVVESGNSNIDIIAAAIAADSACVHVLYIRHGRMLGSRSYYPKTPLAATAAEVLGEFIPQHYLKAGTVIDMPREILLGTALDDAALLQQALTAAAQRKVSIACVSRGTRGKWIDLASRTAEQNLSGRLAASQNTLARFLQLQKMLRLPEMPERLECFDVSHSSGEAIVASCVVFNREGPLKSAYRRFNIAGITPGDDYAALDQALRRRYKRLQQGEAPLPDILFIDGGKGQLRIAGKVLEELGVVGVTLIGVAKGSSRKPGLETLLLYADGGEREVVPTPGGLLLVQQIRDEAHRFAITGHRQRRDKKRRGSPLDDIPGVGPKRKRELLRFFGGTEAVMQASIADLIRVPEINRKVAETIYSTLHAG